MIPDGPIDKTPRFFSTNSLSFAFEPEAGEPVEWIKFLNELWPNDPESIETLQDWFGYLLTHETRQQKLLVIVGPKRSGKGTIARIIRALIGTQNVAGPSLAGLGTNFGLWPLLGKPVAIVSDARLSGRTDSAIVTERLLSISGEDALTVDRKFLQPMTVKLPTRFIILTNELPRLGDSSGALIGRMIVLRMTKSYYGREDPGLADRLSGELPGILRWSVAGWKRLQERGRFIQPQAAQDLVGELEDLSSPVAQFVRECCIVDVQAEERRSTVYLEWQDWCCRTGKKASDETTFGRDLRAAVPGLNNGERRSLGVRFRVYVGIRLLRHGDE